TPYFANDFYVPNRADRNLYLDRIEIARVADAGIDSDDDAAPAMDAMAMGMGPAGFAPGGMVEVVDDPYGSAGVPLRVGFVRPLEGDILPGTFEIDGRCWWAGIERGDPAPVVSLFVNDRVVAKQRAGAPRFWVDASVFEPGANRIKLVARLDDGAVASTPVQTMTWPRAAAEGPPAPPRRHRRFSIHDERWDPAIKETFRTEHHPKERRAAAFYAESEYALDLPEETEGSHHVFAHVRGDHFEGAPVASFYVRHGEAVSEIGRVEAPNWWDTRRAGIVELERGPKQLVVAFENDHFEPDVGDRNLWLQSVILAQRPVEPDRVPPVVETLYPPHEGHAVHMADALVAECSDNASLASATLLVDGVARGINVDLNLKPGRVVLPVLARTWTAGEHEVALQVTDVTGNSTISEAGTVQVTPDPPAQPGPYLRAVRLLDRFAYGPDAGELAAILTMGEEAWLADRLGRSADEPGDLAAMAAPYHYLVGRNNFEVPRRVLTHTMLTPNPARARFVLWAQNHFSTWIRKAGGIRKWDEHIAFWRIGAGRFDHLLLASAESPAMLAYLDQERSFAGQINENYSREIMELHTMGVDGGYTQADVTNLALLLTGWTAAFEGDGRGGGMQAVRYAYRFDPQLSDGGATRVLGLAFPSAEPAERYDRTRLALELLAAHPSTARHVSRKLAEHYVRAPAPDGLVDDLERVFLETGGDMKAMLMAIAVHPEFWNDASAERVASPLDYAIRICRATGFDQPWQVADFLNRSGHGLFDRPSPDGYPDDDEAYADSNAMVQRWRFAAQIGWQLSGLAPNSLRYAGNAPEDLWQQAVVDAIAVGITGRVLSPESNQAALDVLAGGEGNRDQRLRVAAPFIAALPEGNLR
ncbi:MAG: DUF1800 domain-containing protein, partial [Planctomycetota bacterium]